MKIRASVSHSIFSITNIVFLLLLSVVMVYPVWYVICASFSTSNGLMAHMGVLLMPVGLSFEAYSGVFKNPMVAKGYINTLIIVSGGVGINMILTCLGAYCLSRKNLYWGNTIMKLITVTMFFSGGLIPSYLLVTRTLGLNDSFWALMLPSAINTYYLIIMRTAFKQIPGSLIESAKLDGATHRQILTKVVLPLSTSIIAVLVLYYTVGHWNSWFPASIYLKSRSKFPLQLILREILIQNDTVSMSKSVIAADQYSVGETIKYAIIVVATVPILIVYPFLQRYFVKGIMIGAVKE